MTGGNVNFATLNNQSVVYAADQDTDNVVELYASDLNFGSADFKVYVPLIQK